MLKTRSTVHVGDRVCLNADDSEIIAIGDGIDVMADAIRRLAAYEDTGLSPEEGLQYKAFCHSLEKSLTGAKTKVSELLDANEILTAERDALREERDALAAKLKKAREVARALLDLDDMTGKMPITAGIIAFSSGFGEFKDELRELAEGDAPTQPRTEE